MNGTDGIHPMGELNDWQFRTHLRMTHHDLRRALGPTHLIALGIGGIIGAGIFVSTGQAAAQYAGPAVVLSFAIAGLGCFLAGLCYAEFSSMILVAGSAHSYAYATLGQFFAWIIGWDLILEYLAAASAVSSGWSGYFNATMAEFGINLPPALTTWPTTWDGAYHFDPEWRDCKSPPCAFDRFFNDPADRRDLSIGDVQRCDGLA